MHKNETFWRQLLKQYLIDVRPITSNRTLYSPSPIT